MRRDDATQHRRVAPIRTNSSKGFAGIFDNETHRVGYLDDLRRDTDHALLDENEKANSLVDPEWN